MIPIQYIIKATDVAVAAEQTQTALEAGLRWIHLSMPEASDAEVLPVAEVLRKMFAVFMIWAGVRMLWNL